jgi:hypothetical protein
LDGQRRQNRPLPATERRVPALKLTQKNGSERPGIRRDVVDVEGEQVPVARQTQQARQEDRPAAKVEAVLEMALEVLEQLSVIGRR